MKTLPAFFILIIDIYVRYETSNVDKISGSTVHRPVDWRELNVLEKCSNW